MKSALLKPQQRRLRRIAPRALWKNKHALPLPPHLARGAIKRLHGRLAIAPINKHRPTQRHEPTEKRHALEALLRRDRAVGRENGAEEKNVELGLVVADEDGRAGG